MLNKEALRDAMYCVCANLYKGFNIKAPHEQENIVEYWCMTFEDKYVERLNKGNECTFERLCEAFKEYNKSVTNESGEAPVSVKPLRGVIVYKDSNFKTDEGEPRDLPEKLRSFLVSSFQPYFCNVEGEELEGTVLTSGYFTIYPTKLDSSWKIERCYLLED